MAKKRKITRKQMKQPDEFITFSNRVIDYVTKERRRESIIIGSIIVAGLLIYLITDFAIDVYNNNAYDQYYQALETFGEQTGVETPDGNTKIDVDYQKAANAFEAVIDDHGLSAAADLAKFYLGLSYFNLEDYQKAAEALEDYVDSMDGQPIYQAQGLFALARVYEASGDNNLALETYNRMSELPPTPYESIVNQQKQVLQRQVAQKNDFFDLGSGSENSGQPGAGGPGLDKPLDLNFE